MEELELLFKIYKNTFYSKASKRISLNKIETKTVKLEKKLNREMLHSACARFVNYLDDNSEQATELKRRLDTLIEKLAKNDYKTYKRKIKDVKLSEIFEENGIYRILTQDDIIYYYVNQYIPKNIKNGIKELITTSPEQDYPTAREMKRHFVLHIGPTNSGKTYESLERLKECKKGIYLGPLRLLALEVYDKFNRENIPCNMITGEEELLIDGAICQASTIEMLNTDDYYDIAVIDEAQLIEDPRRGYNWTTAIRGRCANEIHVCMAHSAENIIKQLIERCNDTYEIHYHERMTKLNFCDDDININNFYNKLQKGDALIAFSKRSVLAIASELERQNIKASVIYGNLPPDARKNQVELFTSGKTQVVVSTDAIGMGLNLPIRRIIFVETAKFDGTTRRMLNSQEIKQIAGRAGRRGLYEEGFCLSLKDKKYVKQCLLQKDNEIKHAPLGFPETLLELPYDINYIIQTWSEVKTTYPFIKMDVKELLILYYTYNRIDKKYTKNHTKKDIYNFITCPVDLKNEKVINDWSNYCKLFDEKTEYDMPIFDGNNEDLNDLETFYKQLDLYFQFSRKMQKIINKDLLIKQKKDTVYKINKLLKESYKDFTKKCNICGKPLPINFKFNMCNKCFNRNYYWG